MTTSSPLAEADPIAESQLRLLRAAADSEGRPEKLLSKIFTYCSDDDLAGLQSMDPTTRRSALVRFRQGADAKRDAGLVMAAAANGRPLELAKRLRLGKLASGLEQARLVPASTRVAAIVRARARTQRHDPEVVCRVMARCTPLFAAVMNGHAQCADLLQAAAEE